MVVSAVAGAAKLRLGLRKPHLWVLNPKIREFDGNVDDGCGGGGLGGQRGDDCRIDLGLQGGGLFRHPKNKRKCGLELG